MKTLKTKELTSIALFIALAIVLSFLKIVITQFIEIHFKFIPIAFSGFFFGPVVGGIVGGLADVLGYLVYPTGPFHLGFTISTIMSGIIYGLVLKGKTYSFKKIIFAVALNTLIVSMGLNTLWLSQLYGQPFLVVLISRIIKEVIMLPINIAILSVSIKLLIQLPITKILKSA